MKVAVLSESPADEAAVRILVQTILGTETQPIGPPPLRTRGWPSVRQVLPSVLKHLHYRTEAEALVLVVDSNHSPPHQAAHDQPGGANDECRLCQLRRVVDQTRRQLTPVPNRPVIKAAVGLGIPAIEAWFRVGIDGRVTEANWAVGLQSGIHAYSRHDLKQAVYGTVRPSLELETRRALEEANRIAQSLPLLEELFPNGFGALAREVRSW